MTIALLSHLWSNSAVSRAPSANSANCWSGLTPACSVSALGSIESESLCSCSWLVPSSHRPEKGPLACHGKTASSGLTSRSSWSCLLGGNYAPFLCSFAASLCSTTLPFPVWVKAFEHQMWAYFHRPLLCFSLVSLSCYLCSIWFSTQGDQPLAFLFLAFGLQIATSHCGYSLALQPRPWLFESSSSILSPACWGSWL